MNDLINRLLRLISGTKEPKTNEQLWSSVAIKATTMDGIHAEIEARAKVEPNVAFMRDLTKEVMAKYFTTSSRNLMAAFHGTLQQERGDAYVQDMMDMMGKMEDYMRNELEIDNSMLKTFLLMSMLGNTFMNVELKRRQAPLNN